MGTIRYREGVNISDRKLKIKKIFENK